MKIYLSLTLCLTLFLLACSPGQQMSVESSKKSNYLISNISVIPINTNHLLKNQTVWIKDNKIQYIGNGQDLKTAGRPQKIDGSGQYLMPGLSDMHVHLPGERTDRFLHLNLLNGITNIRSMRGDASHLKLRKDIESGLLLGPKIICSAPPIHAKMDLNEMQIDSLFTNYKKEGYDLLKILSIKDLATFQSLQAASKKHQLPIGGHTPLNVGIKNLLAEDAYSIEHLGGYLAALKDSEAFLDKMIEQTVRSKTYNCPTLDWYNLWQFSTEALQERQGLEFVPELIPKWEEKRQKYKAATTPEERQQDRLDTRERISKKSMILKKLHEKGAMILVSPDATGTYQVPGFCVLEELKLYRDAGISNFDILKMATWNAAQYCGKEKQFGSVETGKEADLIILDKNPLENIENLAAVNAVFVQGQLLPREQILSLLKKKTPTK